PGYLPMTCDPAMAEVFRRNAVALYGEAQYRSAGHRTGSTDMGDLGHVMPILHPFMGGARGGHHAADFEIVDRAHAYVEPAKMLAATAIDLMGDGAAGARAVLAQAKPAMTREAYLSFQRGLARREVYDA